jgi:hypothetical protein
MRSVSSLLRRFALIGLSALVFATSCSGPMSMGRAKKVLLIAGPPSHGPGAHEHNAGILLLQKCLANVPQLKTSVALNGWPTDPQAFAGVDAVIIYADGGARHIALQDDHLAVLDRVLATGAGLGLLHFATEPTKEKGQDEFLRWVGGAFEIHRSVNPHWTANFTSLPSHPVTRGVKPFALLDEWYFNLRFVDGLKGVTPLLVAVPDAVREPAITSRPDGHHAGNPDMRAKVARGEPQTVSWAFERPNGGRGFGFTGGHFHTNWGNENFRRLVLNAVLWLAKTDVPASGVQSTVTEADLAVNLDPIDPKTKRKIQPATSAAK